MESAGKSPVQNQSPADGLVGADPCCLKLGLPKGRMQEGVFQLLAEAGIHVQGASRSYRPTVSLPGIEAKILKPQSIVEMLAVGSRDIGFAGADWVRELGVDLVEVIDTGLDPVRLVAAAPESLLEQGRLPKRRLIVASEYERITGEWVARKGIDAVFLHSYGATEVYPPEDADLIVDNTATGSTLSTNRLVIMDTLMLSSTRMYASPMAMRDAAKRERIETLRMLLRSVLEARGRAMLELNVSTENLDRVIAILPCMREPTVSRLHNEAGFAVKAAVPRGELPLLIPRLKANGGTDVVVTNLSQIVP